MVLSLRSNGTKLTEGRKWRGEEQEIWKAPTNTGLEASKPVIKASLIY